MTNLEQIASGSQDIVFSSWAMQYVGDLPLCFGEAYRVLKTGGIYVFSFDHPFWRTLDKHNMKVKVNYFDMPGQRYSEPFKKGTFVAYRHTMSEIVNSLVNTGFRIERMEEPDPRDRDGQILTETTPESYKREAMKLIPRTVIFKARKE
jgi:ubiquinone/menaquinone biosynthesis C-methylase UbiE